MVSYLDEYFSPLIKAAGRMGLASCVILGEQVAVNARE